jgi:hypothetical protein
MESKITAIILFVVGLGIALYFVKSGGVEKFGTVFHLPNESSSTASVAAASTTLSVGATTATSSSAGIDPISNFFHLLFYGPGTSTAGPPTLSSGLGMTGTNYNNTSTYISSPGGVSAGMTSTIPASEIPAGYTLAQLSPYFHEIRFAGISTYEISLYNYDNNAPTSTIDITGWEIKTNRGGEYLPQAVNIYDPLGANPPSDIILFTNQENNVYLYSNSSPVNVRANECMGYLDANSQFNPELPNSCPAIDYSVITNFSGECQNYIESLGSCGTVNMTDPRIPQYDYACQQYLEHNFTYSSCITNHDHDPNFLGDNWYVWMGSSPLDEYHDNVVLLDKNGLVVDTYSY